MNQAIPLANPGLTLDGVTIERPRPKEAIITIKIRSFIILYLLIFFLFIGQYPTLSNCY